MGGTGYGEEKTTKNNKNTNSVRYDDYKLKYTKKVKTRLQNEYNKSHLTPDGLVAAMRDRNYYVNKNTVQNMVNLQNKSTFDIWLAKGLCECFNISIVELLDDTLDTEQESIPEPVVDATSNIDAHNKLLQTLKSYIGMFFCYSNSKNFSKSDIVEFKLEIKENNGIVALLTYYGNVDRRTGKQIVRTYTCVPKMLGANEAIILEFTKEGHSFFHFYINYKGFFFSPLYHRRGFYVSSATDNKHSGAPIIILCKLTRLYLVF